MHRERDQLLPNEGDAAQQHVGVFARPDPGQAGRRVCGCSSRLRGRSGSFHASNNLPKVFRQIDGR